ncbi:MAG: division/cell wall cluster transcriptional repressor MraZ [Patescibacteria group bacterium]|jgi:MraZ protein|nr:division/cell wall cluster transcriptional repressor MraZ [Patescibacteria group bacterium]
MLIGEYHYNLDNKGRLAIPAKLRNELGGSVIVTRGLDTCLFIYPKKEWDLLLQRLNNLPLTQANSRAFSRFMLAGAVEAEIDQQGRILIPEYLRQFAKLNKKVIIAGINNRLEIWDENSWNDYRIKTEKEVNDIAEKLIEFGI